MVLSSACSVATTSSSTTADDASTTTELVTTSTSVSSNGRVLHTVGCADATDDVAIVCEAYDIISQNYVDEVADIALAQAAEEAVEALDGSTSTSELTCPLPSTTFASVCDALPNEAEDSREGAEAIVRGMANALDPNSVYLDPDAVALIREEQEGQIEGIGALVTAEDDTITDESPLCNTISVTCRLIIVSTIEGSPAEAAGLQSDDVLIEVDGESILGWTLDEVTATVRGPAGTDVELTFERGGSTFEVTITRAAVEIPVVDSEVYGDVGYVRLNIFSDNADEQLELAIRDVLDQGVDELVFDLRDNPGGLLDTAIAVASFFIPDGDVVITQNPDDDRAFPVTGDVVVPADLPVVVVINRGSASASEVVAAVLQERGRATVTGENSFGKNTVQQQFSLSNGGAFKVTIARWITPGGHDFGTTGVTPDVEGDYTAELEAQQVAELAAAVN